MLKKLYYNRRLFEFRCQFLLQIFERSRISLNIQNIIWIRVRRVSILLDISIFIKYYNSTPRYLSTISRLLSELTIYISKIFIEVIQILFRDIKLQTSIILKYLAKLFEIRLRRRRKHYCYCRKRLLSLL